MGTKGDQSQLKKRQIDTLKIFNDNVKTIKEDELYSIDFKAGDKDVKIKISLLDFPNKKPMFVIEPLLDHPWLDSSGNVTASPGVLNFTPLSSDLGRVAQAIIREFEKNPPSLLSNASSNQPIVESSMPELQNLNLNQLEMLLKDDIYFEDFVEESPLAMLNASLDELITDIEKIANENLSRESEVIELKSNVENLSCQFLELGQRYDISSQNYQKKSEDFSPKNIQDLLQVAVANSDFECEGHIEKFMSKEISVQDFLSGYMEAKKLSTLRKFKEDRLSYQLNAFEKANF